MPKADFYETLGVPRDASDEQIKNAYRALARKLHPDVNKAEDAAARFAEVQEAYDVLSDPEKRRLYDRAGHAGFEGAPGPGAWSSQGVPIDMDDLGSMFDTFFGGRDVGSGFGGFGAQQTRARAPRRGADLQHTSTIDLETAARGGTQKLVVSRDGKSSTIEVTIPKGVANGAKLRVRGQGQPGSTPEAPRGDLILTIRVSPHPRFVREGLDLTTEVPLTIAQATLGAKVPLRLLLGGEATITVPPSTPSGTRLRVRGAGLEDQRGAKGDLYVQIKIVPPRPDQVDDSLREALEALNARQDDLRTGVGS